MIALAFAFITAAQEPKLSPEALISGMLKRYYSATTIRGKIVTVQTALTATVNQVTDLAIKNPGQFRIAQARDGKLGGNWLAVSDGKFFSYDRPPEVLGKARFVELVTQNGITLTNRQMYQVITRSLGDKNAVLDIAISREADLKALVGLWGKDWQTIGEETVAGRTSYRIGASMRPFLESSFTDHVEMVIDSEFNLLRYQVNQIYLAPGSREKITVRSDLTVDLRVNEPIPDSVFSR